MAEADVDPCPGAVPPSDARPLRRSPLACTRCRQQKMKCSGGPSPPCDRCRKSGSFCLFEPPPPPPPPPNQPAPFHPLAHPFTQAFVHAPSATIQYLEQSTITSDASQTDPALASASPRQCYSPGRAPSPASPVSTTIEAPSTDTQCRPSLQPASPSSPEGDDAPPRKRRRAQQPSESHQRDSAANSVANGTAGTPSFGLDESNSASSPYQTVQNFEAAYRQSRDKPQDINPPPASNPCPDLPSVQLPYESMFSRCSNSRGALSECLCAVGLTLGEAKDMYALFGDRVGPFVPWLYDQDFSTLPREPLLLLASIRVISRYLPGVSSLRFKLDKVVGGLLRHVLFDDLGRSYDAVLETMKGLAIVYGYSEVGVATSRSASESSAPDVLSTKGIVEGYAVRWNIGKPDPSNSMGCLLWIWLFTQSNYYSILLGCPRTLSAGQHLRKAKEVVQQTISHPQVSALLGELDMCLAIDPEYATPPSRSDDGTGGCSRSEWPTVISALDTTATKEGRRLRFHCKFAQFYWVISVRERASPTVTSEALEAGRAFLHCITKASPVIKGRVKYMPEFGFVMLVFVCCFILRALEPIRHSTSRGKETKVHLDPSLKAAVVQDVEDVADLLISLSHTRESVTAAYGRALQGACKSLGAECPSVYAVGVSRPPQANSASPLTPTGGDFLFSSIDATGTERAMGQMVYEPFDSQTGIEALYQQPGADQQDDPDAIPWYGNFVDASGGMLLDALSMPY